MIRCFFFFDEEHAIEFFQTTGDWQPLNWHFCEGGRVKVPAFFLPRF